MAGTLRDDLASLKIDRDVRDNGSTKRGVRTRGSDRGIGLLSLLLWMIPLGLVGFGANYAYKQYEQLRNKTEVTVGLVQTMTTGEAEKLLSAKGYLKARKQAMIGTRIPGRVKKINVVEGDEVQEGALLAELEHVDMDHLLESRRHQVSKTKADLAEARADLKEKQWEADRAERLDSRKMVSPEEYQKAAATAKMAEARVAGLEAQIKLQESSVKESEANIEYMKIFAPFTGTVVDKQGEVGEIINPMSMSSTSGRSAIVTLASLGTMDVEADVAENLLSRIKEGQPAEVSVSAIPDRRFTGSLYKIIPMSDRTRGTVKVKVEIHEHHPRLYPELVATVHFLPMPKKEGVAQPASQSYVFMPKAAVFEENGHSYAWVVGDKSKVSKRQVEVAVTNDELARVETGLKSGESVVVNPPKTLRENETVKVAE